MGGEEGLEGFETVIEAAIAFFKVHHVRSFFEAVGFAG